MKPLRLIIPDQQPGLDNADYPRLAQVSEWLDALPLGNPEKTAGQLLVLLRHYNSSLLDSSVRTGFLNQVLLPLNETAKALQARYRDTAYPLSERNQSRQALVDQLYAELAVGYKCIVIDLHDKPVNEKDGELFINAVDKAIHYLAKQMLAAYMVYMSEPEGMWGDLHQLYQCAEQFAMHDLANEKDRLHHLVVLAKRSYRRIVLMSVANPYHLMQGEVQVIYNYLNKWVSDTKVASLSGYVAELGDLVIDLNSDKPPQFIFDMDIEEPEKGRTVEMSQLMEKFKTTIEKFNRRRLSSCESSITFNERLRRDMLFRLQRVWEERKQRKSVRKATDSRVRMAEGLSACHYFIDGEQEFFPERDEIKIHTPDGLNAGLSLIPDDYEPWKQEKLEDQLVSGLEKTRISNFDDQAMDVWCKIYANKSSGQTERLNALNHFETYYWHLVNHSVNGIGLKRYKVSNARVRVGSIVAFQDDTNKDSYSAGVICWTRQSSAEDLTIGVEVLPGTPKACAVRGLGGAGAGSEYFRSILMRTPYKEEIKKTLVVPASIYDVGSSVVLNLRDEIKYLKLTNVLRTTTTFTHFDFEEMALPEEESARIDKIKKMS